MLEGECRCVVRVGGFVRLWRGDDLPQTEKPPCGGFCVQLSIGRGDRIRTYDLYVPNVALYQTELHPDEPTSLTGHPRYGKWGSPADGVAR